MKLFKSLYLLIIIIFFISCHSTDGVMVILEGTSRTQDFTGLRINVWDIENENNPPMRLGSSTEINKLPFKIFVKASTTKHFAVQVYNCNDNTLSYLTENDFIHEGGYQEEVFILEYACINISDCLIDKIPQPACEQTTDGGFDTADADGDGDIDADDDTDIQSDVYDDTQHIDTVECIDNDGDQYGDNCSRGDDCDDISPLCNVDCSDDNNNNIYDCKENCTDNDNDGYGIGTGCLGSDCNDNKPHCNTSCTDSDNDSYCIGHDCDDADQNNWLSCDSCIDSDNDSYYTGCDSYVTIDEDCDDADQNNWLSCDSCIDSDNDSYYTGCDSYVTIDEDCLDTSAFCTEDCETDSDDIVGPDCNELTVFSAGFNHTCASNNLGESFCWGKNDSGQLGLGDTNNQNTPQKINLGWFIPSNGNSHTCGLMSYTNGIYCWGNNSSGQLGLGNNNNYLTPQPLTAEIVGFVSSGYEHTCSGGYSYVSPDNNIYCWGNNSYGQLGLNDTTNYNTPQNTGLTAIAVSSGYYHTCTVTNENLLYCWGRNNYGQLGNGSTDNNTHPAPEQVNLENVVGVYAGGYHTCAIKNNTNTEAFELYCWGKNSSGQLGLGDNNDYNTPQLVDFDISYSELHAYYPFIKSVSLGEEHTCALEIYQDDTEQLLLYCWGKNSFGQLGLGDTNNRNTPQLVNINNIIFNISAGSSHTCAGSNFSTSNKLYCWGDNSYGQLGLGNNDNITTPTILNE